MLLSSRDLQGELSLKGDEFLRFVNFYALLLCWLAAVTCKVNFHRKEMNFYALLIFMLCYYVA